MCLEFLFSSHREEDGPEHNHPSRNHANDVTRQNNSGEQKNGDYYPDKNDPPSKSRYSDPSANGSEHRRMMENNQVANDRAATNGDTNMTMPKEDHPKVGSMAAFNGGNKVSNAVHPSRPSDTVPRHVGNNTVPAPAPAPPPKPRRGVESIDSVPHHVGNNTVLAAPAPQPNPRRGVESNVLRDNGGTHYRKVPKPEEEEEED